MENDPNDTCDCSWCTRARKAKLRLALKEKETADKDKLLLKEIKC